MLLEHEDNWPTFFQDVARKGRLVCESNSRNKAGEDIVVEVSVSSLQYKGKEIVQAYVRSISKQKEDEHAVWRIRLEYEAVQKQLQAAIRERLETEKILTAMQGQLFHHNKNTLETLAVFFTSKGKKVKKKKQQD
jgi:hypothetical protein